VCHESGAILDGHTRAAIAGELGIDYPTVVRAGLPVHEKRILAAEMNLSRRHLLEYQKVELAGRIEPDYAKRAAARKKAGKTIGTNDPKVESGKTLGANAPKVEVGKTRDVVAKVVGLGSGKSLERKKIQVKEVKESALAPELVPKLEKGEVTIAQAVKEVRTKKRKAKQAEAVERDTV
jgi:hypothetical protein